MGIINTLVIILSTYVHTSCSYTFVTTTKCIKRKSLHNLSCYKSRWNRNIACAALNIKQQSSSSSSSLCMHMGHDHSHSHMHSSNAATTMKVPSIKKTLNIILISFLTTLLPLLVKKHHTISRTNIAVSLLVTTGLFLYDDCKKQVQNIFSKLRNLRNGILKHTSFTTMNYKKTINYIFRNDNAADRVTILGAIINILLSISKFFIGVTCNSSALIADAGHSLSDLFSDFITLWACQVARLPPDDDHPYGHGKFEAIGSLFLAMTLFATGMSIGVASNASLLNVLAAQRAAGAGGALSASIAIPTPPALLCAAASILSKEWLFRITRRIGERLNSPIVTANAWHHRSDAFSSMLALASIGLAMFVPSLLAADSIAGILVAGMICTTGVEILGQSLNQLSDSNNAELVTRVTQLTNQMGNDIIHIKRIRARQVGSKSLVDVAVTTPDDLSISAIRTIEEVLRYRILEQESDIVLDADVHASSSTIVCPLLLAINHHSNITQNQTNLSQQQQRSNPNPNIENNNNKTPISILPHKLRSTSHIDEYVRTKLMSNEKIYNVIKSIEHVTVHYHDTLFIHVDVTIRLHYCDSNSNIMTIERVNSIATNVRHLLENTRKIHKANIYLDLNECHDDNDEDNDCPVANQTMEFA